ncbi:hypothetical protein [Laspinema palackyanum]|uniref:hypothetical protein n=1 Tax=Laspinema palackyanum TaxID=3231601 RepID=UPI00345CCF70|nr:hypothetical protein [Laspinema sp. D2c]
MGVNQGESGEPLQVGTAGGDRPWDWGRSPCQEDQEDPTLTLPLPRGGDWRCS